MGSLHEQLVVGECYILQSRVAVDFCSEHWVATAIFSASKFLLRFVKPELVNDAVAEELRRESLRNYNIRGPVVKDCIEIEFFDGWIFISSEYDGEIGLDRYLAGGGRLSPQAACRCAESLARGLQSFHEYALVFGNLNPENVLVADPVSDKPGMIILKPGLSALIDASGKSPEAVSATYAFLSPECKRGAGLYPGSDVYSLGVILFRLLAGALPYPDGIAGAKTELASPRFAACALLALGVPERLIRIVVRMIIPDVSRRYSSCLDLLRDLGGFLSSAPVDAAQISNLPYMRAFDSTGYFISLTRPSGSASLGDADVPADQTAETADLLRVKDDLRIAESDRDWSVDDYVDFAREVVLGVHKGDDKNDGDSDIGSSTVGTEGNPPTAVTAPSVPPAVPESGDGTDGRSPSAVPQVRMLPGSPGMAVAENADEDRIPAESVNQVSASPPSVARMPPTAPHGETQRTWIRHRIRVQDVYPVISRLVARARRCKGSFRYIQEPESGYANTALYSSLESLSNRCLYVNAGSCARYGTASSADFLRMLAKAFSYSLSRESSRSRAYLARKVSSLDTAGIFSSVFSDAVPKVDGAMERLVSGDPGLADSLATVICSFARKSKPLVLIIRGGERIQRDLHDLFAAIARKVPDSPVCVVVFYERIRFPPWHVLSRYLSEM